MDRLKRRIAIEALLADWFRQDGWDVAESFATIWSPDDDGDPMNGTEVTISLSLLADHIEQEIDGVIK